MAMVNAVTIDGVVGLWSLAWFNGRWLPDSVLHLSHEPGELSQWQCHDDSTVTLGFDIINIIIICKATDYRGAVELAERMKAGFVVARGSFMGGHCSCY